VAFTGFFAGGFTGFLAVTFFTRVFLATAFFATVGFFAAAAFAFTTGFFAATAAFLQTGWISSSQELTFSHYSFL
jgi:hypothetical protein